MTALQPHALLVVAFGGAAHDAHRIVPVGQRVKEVGMAYRGEERAEVTIGAAEAGVKAIYTTKPMCRSRAEADAMLEACPPPNRSVRASTGAKR